MDHVGCHRTGGHLHLEGSKAVTLGFLGHIESEFGGSRPPHGLFHSSAIVAASSRDGQCLCGQREQLRAFR